MSIDHQRTMLANIYNWFTEGFDTADLHRRQIPARRILELRRSGNLCAVRNAEVTTGTFASSVQSAELRLRPSVRDAGARTSRERISAAIVAPPW